MRRPVPRFWVAGMLLSCLAIGAHAETLTSIEARIGAGAFYSQGFDGSGVIIGNIEGTNPLTSHQVIDQSFQHSFTQPGIASLGASGNTLQSHATSVSSVLVGSDKFNNNAPTGIGHGIAPGATLWTGRIATSASGSSFSTTFNSVAWPLLVMGKVGVTTNGVGATNYTVGGDSPRTVDVINSSWGFSNNLANNVENVIYDHVAEQGVTIIASAGNTGPSAASVGGPANSWNVIAVGATTGEGATESVAFYSSRGPEGSFDGSLPTRNKPDIVAPGGSGSLGGGIDVATGASTTSLGNASGTSFAAPTVAGGAALLIDEGQANGRSTDPRLIKAVLLNSAHKLAGWTQNLVEDNGILVTTTPLDNSQGAGRIDLAKAYTQYTASSGTGTGTGSVGRIGWDTNMVSLASPDKVYYIDGPLFEGTTFDVTLTWFMHRSVHDFDPDAANPLENATFTNDNFDDLDLFVYQIDDLNNFIGDPIAISGAAFDNIEHLHLNITQTGRYAILVNWFGEIFDFTQVDDAEFYALAWYNVVPEPSTLAACGVMALAIFRRRR